MTGSTATETTTFSPNATIRFAAFEVRPHERILSKDGAPQRLGSRAFDLLMVLLSRGDRFVTADELRRIVWPDRVVEDNNLRVHLSALRKVLGPQAIVHHAMQGYRLASQIIADETDDADPYPGNLPPRAELFGRAAVIAALGDALSSRQRVTIVGTAGVGKTTVALATAREQADRYPDGVWLVELAALKSGTLVVSAVAQVLGVKLVNDTSIEALVKAVATRRALLVLDSCEHLVGAVTALCDALLRGATGIVVLATSRKVLRSGGEQVVPLGPLDLPSAADVSLPAARACGALALFESRVRVADPRFALTQANVAAAIEICQRLDGIALAIVLAASRVPLLGISGVRDRLRVGLMPLASRGAHVDDRHRTLVAALEWSHALLGVDEQAVFRRLGAFAGGFALSDAEQVCADDRLDPPLDAERVVACIDGLIEHSLLVTDTAALHGLAAPRFAMHEMIRVHARDRLDGHAEAMALRRRHAAHFARIAEGDAGPGTMKRPDREQSLPAADHDNLRAALDWAVEHAPELALRLATAATGFWRLRAHHAEALQRCDAVLARAEVEEAAAIVVSPDALAAGRARLMISLCGIAFELNRIDLLERHAERSLEISRAQGEARGTAHAILWLAIVLYVRRDLDGATALYLDGRQRCRALGDRDGEAIALANLAMVEIELGRYDEAVAWLHEALALHRALGSHWGMALDMENLGDVAFARGDAVDAHAHWMAALVEFRAVGHEFRIASVLQSVAAVLCRLDRLPTARESVIESLALCRRCSFDALFADGLGTHAAIAAAAGDGHVAAVLLRVAGRERARLGCLASGIAQKTDEEATRIARGLLDERQWRDACVDGDRLVPEQAVALFEAAEVVRAFSRR